MDEIAFIVIITTDEIAPSGCSLERSDSRMLRNLKAEMARNDVKVRELAELLDVRIATIYDKLNGHYDFSLSEAVKIKNHYFKDYDFEYLFNREIKKEVQGRYENITS